MKNKLDLILNQAYHRINILFAGIILLIFIYSGIFSAEKMNHPIQSACANIEGHPCKSEGLSRSFSEIVRFRFDSARSYNSSGIRIFSFFLIQLFLRFVSSAFLHYTIIPKKKLIFVDSFVSIALYVYCFGDLIF